MPAVFSRSREMTHFCRILSISLGGVLLGGVRVCVKRASAMQPISVSLGGVVLGMCVYVCKTRKRNATYFCG